MDRKTKIVATIGPATESEDKIKTLIKEGVNVFRFNMKHNTHTWHKTVMTRVRKVAAQTESNIGIMADLQGPELRTGDHPNEIEQIYLKPKEKAIMGPKPIEGYSFIPFNDLDLVDNISKNDHLFIDDGKIELSILEIMNNKESLKVQVEHGRELGVKKSISIPHAEIKVPTLLAKDKKDIKFAVDNNVDFIALSFVRDSRDIETLKRLIKRLKGNQHIVAKIETNSAMINIEEIIESTDVVMVARGDLGIEVPIERVPKIQERLVKKCRNSATPVIVATQMLMSMVRNPVPSRAEVSDIANSVMDKTDALMLSDETTIGAFPVEAVRTMAKISRYNESTHFHDDLKRNLETYEELIIRSSVEFSNTSIETHQNEIRGYLLFTESGKSARLLSQYRTPVPIFAFTSHMDVTRQLSISFGVKGYNLALKKNPISNIRMAESILKKDRLVGKGDKLIVIFGNNVGEPESNNTISIITVT